MNLFKNVKLKFHPPLLHYFVPCDATGMRMKHEKELNLMRCEAMRRDEGNGKKRGKTNNNYKISMKNDEKRKTNFFYSVVSKYKQVHCTQMQLNIGNYLILNALKCIKAHKSTAMNCLFSFVFSDTNM